MKIIADAKLALFGVAASVASASNCSAEDLPRNRMRHGEGKQRSDAGDILNL